MDETATTASPTEKSLNFSLRQIVALMTAVGSGFALCYVLFSPPLGSSGLGWAMLPAAVLTVAIWFCRTGLAARLGTYTVVTSLLGLLFFGTYISQSDWLFGHTHGPPQLVVASCWASMIGALSGIAWIVSKVTSRASTSAGWWGGIVVVPLTLLSGLLALGNIPSLPRAMQRMDDYNRQRQLRAEERQQSMERYRAALKETHPEIPGIIARKVAALESEDVATRRQEASNIRAIVYNIRGPSPLAQIFDNPATKAALMSALDDNDPEVRRHVAMAIVYLRDQADRAERLKAIAALGIPEKPTTVTEGMVTLLRMLDWETDEQLRCEAIRAVGRMGPAAVSAAPRFGVLALRGTPAERAAAAEALAALGPEARQFLPHNSPPP